MNLFLFKKLIYRIFLFIELKQVNSSNALQLIYDRFICINIIQKYLC